MTELEKTAKKVIDGDFGAQLELLLAFAELGYSITIKKLEEEKKMLNFDKYREEVEKRMGWAVRENPNNPKPVHLILKEIAFGKGLPYMDGDELVDWLFEKYEPPLLEDDDGLKPGDWIMVRNFEENDWLKTQFVYYFEGAFFCSRKGYTPERCEIVRWYQARLPEDGE